MAIAIFREGRIVNGGAFDSFKVWTTCGFRSFFDPDALHAARRDACVTGHAANAPAASPGRRTRDLGHDAFDLLFRQRQLASTPGGFFEAGEPARLEPFRPYGDALGRRLQPDRYLADVDAFEPQKRFSGRQSAKLSTQQDATLSFIAHPAQQESCFTSLEKVCAASFRPSTIVRYGNN